MTCAMLLSTPAKPRGVSALNWTFSMEMKSETSLAGTKPPEKAVAKRQGVPGGKGKGLGGSDGAEVLDSLAVHWL